MVIDPQNKIFPQINKTTGLKKGGYFKNLSAISFSALKNLKTDTVSFSGITKSGIFSFETLLTNIDNSTLDSEIYKLAQIASKGIPVTPGFVILGEEAPNKKLSDKLINDIEDKIKDIEKKTLKGFGKKFKPLILSVKSEKGTVYAGFNADTIEGLLDRMDKNDDNKKFVYDSYQRAISSFGTAVFGIENNKFFSVLKAVAEKNNLLSLNDLTFGMLKDEVIPKFKEIIKQETGKNFPDDVYEQLKLVIESQSVKSPVVVQAKTFSNWKGDYGTGVCFSRDPETGENKISGDFLLNSTGHDLLEGTSRLEPIEDLVNSMPKIYNKLIEYTKKMEQIFHKPQCVSFLIDNGRLQIISANDLDKTAKATIKTAVDMYKEGLITDKEAISLVNYDDLKDSVSTELDPALKSKAIAEDRLLTKGTGASSGGAYGRVAFDSEKAVFDQDNVILVKNDTNVDDIRAITCASGLIAINAGTSSHGAIIARGLGKPCIVACNDLKIDEQNKVLIADDKKIKEGDIISIDGQTGEIFIGKIDTTSSKPSKEYFEILDLADNLATIKVLANADTTSQVIKAKKYGAKGIGLCRTEHMFFTKYNRTTLQQAILTNDDSKRQQALKELEKCQYNDFYYMFETMPNYPITIRLLDPPLNEFLPKSKELIADIVRLEISGNDPKALQEKRNLFKKIEALEEADPMLGRRGARLGVVVPEIYDMQIRAIVKAALNTNTRPQIMIPMISDAKEFELLVNRLKKVAREVVVDKFGAGSDEVEKRLKEFKWGTMIEVPRAALTAGKLAEYADFFCFGTNDLTQMTYGMSRDDAQKGYLIKYIQTGIFDKNPFDTIDPDGVGKLIELAVDGGRKTKPDLKIGVCGEQGGDPASMEFFQKSKVDYVSCSPPKIPAARLAAGKMAIKNIAFTGKDPSSSLHFRVLKKILDEEFANTMLRVSSKGTLTVDDIEMKLEKEYGKETAEAIKVSGDKIGFSNLILLIPGTTKDGRVPDLFPVIDPHPYKGTMGGSHWYSELYLLRNIFPKIRLKNPDFSFQKLRKDLEMDGVNGNKNLPEGISLTNRRYAKDFIDKYQHSDAFDEDGNSNYASIHGFVVYDIHNNNYLILDNKPGIKEFVEKNKILFDDIVQRFKLKEIIIGGDPVLTNPLMIKMKAKSDLINQMRGELYLSGINVTEFPDKNPKEITSTELIQLLTNPISMKKHLNLLQKKDK